MGEKERKGGRKERKNRKKELGRSVQERER